MSLRPLGSIRFSRAWLQRQSLLPGGSIQALVGAQPDGGLRAAVYHHPGRGFCFFGSANGGSRWACQQAARSIASFPIARRGELHVAHWTSGSQV